MNLRRFLFYNLNFLLVKKRPIFNSNIKTCREKIKEVLSSNRIVERTIYRKNREGREEMQFLRRRAKGRVLEI